MDLVVPSWRPDIEQEIEIVEEIAKIIGYDKIKTKINQTLNKNKTKRKRKRNENEMKTKTKRNQTETKRERKSAPPCESENLRHRVIAKICAAV